MESLAQSGFALLQFPDARRILRGAARGPSNRLLLAKRAEPLRARLLPWRQRPAFERLPISQAGDAPESPAPDGQEHIAPRTINSQALHRLHGADEHRR